MISRKSIAFAGIFLFTGLNMRSEMTLASNKAVVKNTIQSPLALKSIKCSFAGIDEMDKSYLLQIEEFSLLDLRRVSSDNKTGVTVNLFDFVDYNFSFNNRINHFVINIQQEENHKKIIKNFSKVPFQFKTAISFSAQRNKKTVYVKEVSVVCNT